MQRKIIQIIDRFINKDDGSTLIALADDGTLWEGQEMNRERAKYNALPYEQRKAITPPNTPWVLEWTQLPGLPDNNTNFQKVR